MKRTVAGNQRDLRILTPEVSGWNRDLVSEFTLREAIETEYE
jgi:hypothetical protein